MNIRTLTLLLYYFSLTVSSAGVLVQSIEMMAAGILGATIGYVLKDYFSRETDSITPITVNAIFFGAWLGLGNLVGYHLKDTIYEKTFYAYSAMDYLLDAQILATLAALIPLITYQWMRRLVAGPKPVLPQIPKVGFEVSDRVALIFSMSLLAIGWVNNLASAALGDLGTFSAIIGRGSEMAIFILTWHWFGPKPTFPTWTRWLLFTSIILDVGYSLMFSYMRGEVAYPLLMFFLALLMRKAVTRKHIAIAVLILPVMAFIYRGIGELRGEGIYGAERVSRLTEQLSPGAARLDSSEEEEGMDMALMSLMARGCLFAQMSQIARIVDEEGFYNGETLQYLTYALIPRIIWPEKPLITPGQWFAEKIGRGQRINEAQFSNSINMSLVGECYLNFGWPGAVVGVTLMTLLYAIFWEASGFYDQGSNPVGQALGIGILFQATVSSSAAGIPNLIFLYIAMLAISRALIFVRRRRNRSSFGSQKSYAVRSAPF